MEWYSLRVISGKEIKIKGMIETEIELSNMQESIPEILVPTENIVEMKDGKKKIKTEVFYPGYVLVKMDMNKETQYLVENINGVINFIGSQGRPEALKPEEINRIIGVVEGADGREVVDVPFKVGDAIKVIDGPFSDFSGYVQEVNKDKQKLKVSVSIFGRPTPIELDFLQVEIEK